jgi:hypothetical protein
MRYALLSSYWKRLRKISAPSCSPDAFQGCRIGTKVENCSFYETFELEWQSYFLLWAAAKTQNLPTCAIVVPFWCHCGVIVVPLWCHCGAIVVSLWCYSGAIVVSLWCHCGAIVVSLWCHSGVIVVLFWCHCSVIVVPLWCHGYCYARGRIRIVRGMGNSGPWTRRVYYWY